MFCTECGKENKDNAKFCWVCGAPTANSGPGSIGGAGGTILEGGGGESRSVGAAGGTIVQEGTARSSGDLVIGTLVEGRYRVERMLGRGGMGEVWLARDAELAMPVALKLMAHNLLNSDSARERFLREARVCLNLNHPGIVRLYHLGKWDGQYYLAMEYLEGQTLAEWMAGQRQLLAGSVWLTIVELLIQIVAAIAHAHENGVIHRDLKPGNIILARRRDKTLPVVMDFGLAKSADQEGGTRTGLALGTPYYMSPEQMDGRKDVDARTDIYSLGAIIYELLTGKPPVGRLVAPSKVVPGLTADVDELVFKCLEHDPSDRYQTAEELAQALRAAGQVPAKPAPAPAPTPVTPQVRGQAYFKFDDHLSPETTPSKAYGTEEGRNYTEDLGGGVKLEMVWVPGGLFMMGSKQRDEEKPPHQVNVKGFWMGKFQVTQEQYEKVVGNNPSHFMGLRNPVEQVSWGDAVAFCRKLAEKTGKHYALPSEAQWEYACRAGNQGKWCFGDNENLLPDYAWYDKNSGSKTHPVGEKKANAWGLNDMEGNVWEWCQDWYHDNYNGAPMDGSAWETPAGQDRVLRGGSWAVSPSGTRSAYRGGYLPGFGDFRRGFRILAPSN